MNGIENEKDNRLSKEQIELLDEYYEMMEIDRNCRFKGVTGDLHSLPIRTDVEGKWKVDSPLPTIIYDGSHNINTNEEEEYMDLPKDDNEFCQRFYQIYPFFEGLNCDGILFAGGAIGRIIKYPKDEYKTSKHKYKTNNRDIDIFFYGLTIEEANKKIEEINRHLEKYYKDTITKRRYNRLKYTMNKNVMTIFLPLISKYEESNQEIQFIFRIYSSKSEILHGFDLGSCAVGFDGKKVYFTSLSKFAYEYGLNIIDTTRRSTSYENRLMKYMWRGFGIVLPQLDMETCIKTWNKKREESKSIKRPTYDEKYIDIRLEYIELRIQQIKGNRTMIGDVTGRYNKFSTINDYGQTSISTQSYMNISDYDQYMEEYIDMAGDSSHRNYKFLVKGGLESGKITLNGYNFEEIFNYKVDREKILSFFNQKKKQIKRMFLKDMNLREKAFERIEKEIRNKYHELYDEIKRMESLPSIFWITDNPGRQLTSSINPIIEDEQEWYGSNFYRPTGTIRQQTIIGSLLGHKNMIEKLLLYYSKDHKTY